ncbi:MAG: ABC-type transport auxiliary lipoprotein family protein [Novosphingobium sp.]
MMMRLSGTMRRTLTVGGLPLALALALALALPGCVSLGGKLPDQLLTLSATATAPAGSSASGTVNDALAVIEPGVPQELDALRVPVQVNDTSIAYIKDAVWVEKPARLFQRLLSETIRAGGTRLVLSGADEQYAAATKLTGHLLAMGYDARMQAVVIRYEAVLTAPGGQISTRRFESEVPGVSADAAAVGRAMNEAANEVAGQVAQWVG